MSGSRAKVVTPIIQSFRSRKGNVARSSHANELNSSLARLFLPFKVAYVQQ